MSDYLRDISATPTENCPIVARNVWECPVKMDILLTRATVCQSMCYSNVCIKGRGTAHARLIQLYFES